MKKKDKIALIIGVAVIIICAIVVIFMLDRFAVIRIFPRPVPKQEKTIQLDDLGSADMPVGNSLVVTIFCGDDKSSWDFGNENDRALRERDFASLKIAAEWLGKRADNYNKTFSLVYPTDENSDLYYEADFKGIICNITENPDNTECWEYIDSKIDSAALKNKYNCDNILYLLFINEYDDDTENDDNLNIDPTAECIYDKEKKYNYEFCRLPSILNGGYLAPAVIAHEIIHLYGAPDLYAFDANDINYGITVEFVQYCRKNVPQDIMLSTYDRETGKRLPDRITQEITDVTAYYIGWLDTPPECIDEYRLVHSQHEYKNGQGVNTQ